MANLTPRQKLRMDELTVNYGRVLGGLDTPFRAGFANGFKEAMRVMYPDAETMFTEDKQAADLVLTVLALESLV